MDAGLCIAQKFGTKMLFIGFVSEGNLWTEMVNVIQIACTYCTKTVHTHAGEIDPLALTLFTIVPGKSCKSFQNF